MIVSESHNTNVTPKGETNLLGVPQNQHSKTYPNNSQINAEKTCRIMVSSASPLSIR